MVGGLLGVDVVNRVFLPLPGALSNRMKSATCWSLTAQAQRATALERATNSARRSDTALRAKGADVEKHRDPLPAALSGPPDRCLRHCGLPQ